MLRPLSLVGDGILFGADNMLPFQRAVQKSQELPPNDHVEERCVGENAARLLGRMKGRTVAPSLWT